MTEIVILCPTRGRPQQFKRMCESALATAHDKGNVSIYFYISDQDPERSNYEVPPNSVIFSGPDYSAVMCLNEMGQKIDFEETKLVMIGADDTIFATPEWDKALLDHYQALSNKVHVYSLQDSRSKDGTPHPILTREYIKFMGYVFPPIFLHWYADSWTAQVAKANDVFTHMADYLLIHDKPSDRGEFDETHLRIRKMGWLHRDTYVAKSCIHFLATEINRLEKAMQ